MCHSDFVDAIAMRLQDEDTDGNLGRKRGRTIFQKQFCPAL
ncbi:hypothetical protein Pr1d_26550 [Bythopirellula goksoeyrii]|uniref:Uncharacterized protein n=1 Tax=Bythopirellula goksoeyrii TaxID=1400387 RepID=A0A5B9Q8N9_9BACT|nr:hypothetical protein Pr1d_26550 [Bythopirellula goksoeyrii]